LQVFESPNPKGHPEFLAAFDGAKTSIKLAMYHLTVSADIASLERAARRGVSVRVILDGDSLKTKAYKKILKELKASGVQVVGSSPSFSITHEKAMTIDDQVAYVTSENLTASYATTRDFGLITHDTGVISEFNRVFEADWKNANSKTGDTPALQNANLLWSPVNAESKLTDLIGSARTSLELYVENLSEQKIIGALAAAAVRGVAVRVLTPLCDKNPNPFFNLPALRRLQAAGASARVMPAPETAETPYIHAKAIFVDAISGYVGSMNFSGNSLLRAREVGMIFENAEVTGHLRETFERDWGVSVPVPAATRSIKCPAVSLR
jgi:phosphatidylserine/phosphatidylglycerophosphate/cardiolipin synthase-like enzyme